MSKRQTLCILGAWVIIFLFLGLPSLWHKILAVITGLAIIIVSYNPPPSHSTKKDFSPPKENDVFVDNKQ